MKVIGKLNILTSIPKEFTLLEEIARNLWWTWNHDAIELFKELAGENWDKYGKNPITVLNEVSNELLHEKLTNENFVTKYNKIAEKYNIYMSNDNYTSKPDSSKNSNINTWYTSVSDSPKNTLIAYFSAEYGLSEVLPIYSGGLGVLSGDHCKSASDLGLPFIAIGLFYRQGYFNQHINKDGRQEDLYISSDISSLPISQVKGTDNTQLKVMVEMCGRTVLAAIWKVNIGRIKLYLLDTDVEENAPHDRNITARLYGGNHETRIQQEIILGIGGLKLLDALGINPTVYHMNEGHSAFLGLELLLKYTSTNGLSFNEAMELVRQQLVFTTHTPVPAGTDVFSLEMMERYFPSLWVKLGISKEEFMFLGSSSNDIYSFNMTILALKLAGRRNGVSQLHGHVSREMFNGLWPELPISEVPIGHITNGIHTLTWMNPLMKALFSKYAPNNWENRLESLKMWEFVDSIPDEELWKTHIELKRQTIEYIRENVKKKLKSNGECVDALKEYDDLFDENVLTIGFARRFATYKRADMIFKDIQRLLRIVNNPKMPVQFVFAGKAHPADGPGQDLIKKITDFSNAEGLKGKVIILENYNMEVSRMLTSGVDVWLNNPRRPLEASGTSGQKVCTNGVLNLSVLDGWWCEGYNGKNGWAIGDAVEHDNESKQDEIDSTSLYSLIENSIVKLYYNRASNDLPTNWIKMMKESIKTNIPTFSTARMVQDYALKMYLPASRSTYLLTSNNFEELKRYTSWLNEIISYWHKVRLYSDYFVDFDIESTKEITINSYLVIENQPIDNYKVELLYGKMDKNGEILSPTACEMCLSETLPNNVHKFEYKFVPKVVGEVGYTFRVLAYHPIMVDKFTPCIVKMAERG